MRAIKFRAWHKKLQKMRTVRALYFVDSEIYAILSSGDTEWGNVLVGEECELMQLTGLKDRKGREIYEGDIVRDARWNILFEVRWCDGKGEFLRSQLGWMLIDEKFCPVGHVEELAAHLENFELNREEYYNGEVVGNIYANPELITQEVKP